MNDHWSKVDCIGLPLLAVGISVIIAGGVCNLLSRSEVKKPKIGDCYYSRYLTVKIEQVGEFGVVYKYLNPDIGIKEIASFSDLERRFDKIDCFNK